MDEVRRYRAMGSLCRQSATLNPLNTCKLLGDAERWEHLAELTESSPASSGREAIIGRKAQTLAKLIDGTPPEILKT